MEKGVKVISKRKLLGAVVVCVVLVAGLAVLWPGRQVAEAAVLNPHPGLVGWWRFDEGDGSVAEDSSGFGNDGTVYGATWVDGKYGKALSFDGTDNYVKALDSSSFDLTDLLTLEAWVYPRTWPSAYPRIMVKESGLSIDSYGLVTNGVTGKCGLYIKGSARVETLVAISLNAWTHIVATYNRAGGKARIYLNGTLNNTQDYAESIPVTTYDLYIGNNPTNERQFDGIIDEVRVYNRALSAAEIQENSQKGPDFSSRLLAKVPKGTTQFIVTLSWQGVGSINVTIESPSKNYTEDMVSVYHKIDYSSSSGDMLNIKRLAVSVNALSSGEDWYVMLEFNDVEDYRITVEVQKIGL